jgi:hypothetical protein
MTLEDLMTSLTSTLTGVIPGATLAIFASAGVVIALAAKFGGRIVKSLR